MDKNIYFPIFSLDDFAREFAAASGGSSSFCGLYKTYETISGFYSRNILLASDEENIREALSGIVAASMQGKPALTSYTEELVCKNAREIFEQNSFNILLIQHGMFFDTTQPFDTAFCPNIIRINSSRIDEWNNAMLRGFSGEKGPEPDTYRALVKDPNMMVYAYIEDGKIAGTAIMLLRKDNSGIHEVAVPEEYRRKGIANKLILKALKDAKAYGCKTVSLQASDSGRYVYEAIGFRECSQIYTWELKK